jgi:hypothetical protein
MDTCIVQVCCIWVINSLLEHVTQRRAQEVPVEHNAVLTLVAQPHDVLAAPASVPHVVVARIGACGEGVEGTRTRRVGPNLGSA